MGSIDQSSKNRLVTDVYVRAILEKLSQYSYSQTLNYVWYSRTDSPANYVTGDNITIMFGKIYNWFRQQIWSVCEYFRQKFY